MRPVRFLPAVEQLDVRCQPAAGTFMDPASKEPTFEPGVVRPPLAATPTLRLPTRALDGPVVAVWPEVAAGRTATVNWGDGVVTSAALTDTADGLTTVDTARLLDADETYHVTVTLADPTTADAVVLELDVVAGPAEATDPGVVVRFEPAPQNRAPTRRGSAASFAAAPGFLLPVYEPGPPRPALPVESLRSIVLPVPLTLTTAADDVAPLGPADAAATPVVVDPTPAPEPLPEPPAPAPTSAAGPASAQQAAEAGPARAAPSSGAPFNAGATRADPPRPAAPAKAARADADDPGARRPGATPAGPAPPTTGSAPGYLAGAAWSAALHAAGGTGSYQTAANARPAGSPPGAALGRVTPAGAAPSPARAGRRVATGTARFAALGDAAPAPHDADLVPVERSDEVRAVLASYADAAGVATAAAAPPEPPGPSWSRTALLVTVTIASGARLFSRRTAEDPVDEPADGRRFGDD